MANTSLSHGGGQGKQASSPGVKKPPIVSTSWSFTDNEPDTKYDHAWSIANFAKKMEMENGEELKSGVFSIRTKDRTTDWFMRINPNGEEKTCKGFVSLFLYKVVTPSSLSGPITTCVGRTLRGSNKRRHYI